MNNEELAYKIAKRHYRSARQITDSQKECYDSALEMAELKDNKFYTILACIQYSFEKQQFKGVDEFINDIKKQWEE